MKQIKFRVWDIEKNEYIYSDREEPPNQFVLSNTWKHIGGKDKDIIENCSDIWEQYTGVLDKVNKPIYEGDIVRFPFSAEEIALGKVIFSPYGTFALQVLGNAGVVLPLLNYFTPPLTEIRCSATMSLNCYYFEIVGNVHESDKELLEEHKEGTDGN